MDFQAIIQAISTVGFPIVAFGLMYYMVNNSVKELKDTVSKSTSVMEKVLLLLQGEQKEDK